MRFALRVASLFLAFILAAAVVLGAAWVSGFKLPFQTSTIDRSQPVVLKSIEELSQYHAAVGNFEVVVDQEQDVDWVPSFIAGERSLFVAAGTVDGFVDFSGLAEGDVVVSEENKTVEIRLPEAQLTEPNLDQDRTYLFSEDKGLVDAVSEALETEDQQALYQLAEEKMATAAEASELRQQAEENTRSMLTGMMGGLGYTVVFTDEGASAE